MDKDINHHIQTCHKCQVRKKHNPAGPALLSPLQQCIDQGIHADLFRPLRVSGQAKEFILCMTDAFPKYFELVALLNKESATVASAIFLNGSVAMVALWKLWQIKEKSFVAISQKTSSSYWLCGTTPLQHAIHSATARQKWQINLLQKFGFICGQYNSRMGRPF